jgi:predicted Zn-dependent protease
LGARVAVTLVAVVTIAWLGIMERDTRLQDRAVDTASGAIAFGRLTPAQLRAAESDFRDARFLNPDTAPDVNRAVMYQVHGRGAEARALLEDVVRREPENLTAWGVLVEVTRERDPAASRRAAAARRRLDPLSARR